jgi:hypothetical protein
MCIKIESLYNINVSLLSTVSFPKVEQMIILPYKPEQDDHGIICMYAIKGGLQPGAEPEGTH